MAAEDWIPDWWDRDDEDVTCKRCGAEGLHWEWTETFGWRLFNDRDRRHYCDEATADEFPNLKED